ncbi:hypothetical protein DMA11_00410 [Marinilabiliaceae bacterium JC017]|nr:hypothetical protein DMA11_00410 [Marinilabiliaceae bacterium JC017]
MKQKDFTGLHPLFTPFTCGCFFIPATFHLSPFTFDRLPSNHYRLAVTPPAVMMLRQGAQWQPLAAGADVACRAEATKEPTYRQTPHSPGGKRYNGAPARPPKK